MDEQEIIYLSRVHTLIDDEISRLDAQRAEEGRKIREETKEYMAENPFAAVYGRSYEFIRETESRMDTAEKLFARVRSLREMRKAPYFGRVDFYDDEEGEEEKIYVGFQSLYDGSSGDILVFDWRAPVSSLFYTGETGPASYPAPCGEIKGTINRIRQYLFENGRLKSYWDADLRIDDTVLRDVLSGEAGGKMKNIVCTIQREQNRAIRFHAGKSLTVFGPAGSGKTSIGMHRLAWLLYEMRASGFQPFILMFTGNEAFRSYIAGVLPELGERETRTQNFATLFHQYLPGFSVETALEQTEALLEGNRKREETICALYGEEFISSVESSFKNIPVRFHNISLFGSTVVPAAVTLSRFRALPPGVPVKKRLETVAEWVNDEITNYFLIHKKELINAVLEKTEAGDSYTENYRRLKGQLQARARQMVLDAAETNPETLYCQYVRSFFGNTPLTHEILDRIQNKILYFEDAVWLLYIGAKLGVCAVKSPPTHILIDEAQDYSPLQHKILKTLYPKAVFTVLADVNQGITPRLNTKEEAFLCTVYDAQALYLGKSYRSTKQLCEFSKQFLPPEKADFESFDREGPAPFIHSSPDAVQKTAEIIREGLKNHHTVCVILKTVSEADRFFKKLKPLVPDCTAILSEKKALSGRITCIPVTLAKGLEFDCVILPFADNLGKEPGVSYLMTTRALHELHLINAY